MFQSLTGRLKTDRLRGCDDDPVEFQSLTGRLKTLERALKSEHREIRFNPSQVG